MFLPLLVKTEVGFCSCEHSIFFHSVPGTVASNYGQELHKRKKISLHGDAMVSTGVLKVGIAIRGPVNRVIKLEPFLKRNDKNNFALAA